jgi:RNA polymerase sigma-70 factor (ECF subfamily)
VTAPDDTLAALYRAHRARVWAIAYRMTGSAADADDLAQETFARALASPPKDTTDVTAVGPWLVKTAVNASIDLLRQRKRRAYVGPWLPEPIVTGDAFASPSAGMGTSAGTDARYDLLETVTLAFLVALEALSARARAVLLLRDVFDYSVRETAFALGMTEDHVKVTHHRARKVMATYDADPCVPTREVQDATRAVMARLLAALASGDVAAVEALLAEDVRTVNDSAGDYLAARVPVLGREKVARFWSKLTARGATKSIEERMLNGLPAILVTLDDPSPTVAPHVILTVRLDARGLAAEIHGIVATAKCARVFQLTSPRPFLQ